MRYAWLAALGILLCGCSGDETPIARAAGSWPGQFAVESADGKTDKAAIDAELMKGNLHLYATGMKFRLEMNTKHQGFTIGGKWTAQKDRVTITADTWEFDNPTDEDQKALGLKLISPDDLRTTFGHAVVFDESADKRKLTGLKTSLGKLVGRFEFVRPIPR